jgi:hypothetical protein
MLYFTYGSTCQPTKEGSPPYCPTQRPDASSPRMALREPLPETYRCGMYILYRQRGSLTVKIEMREKEDNTNWYNGTRTTWRVEQDPTT